MKDSLPSIYTLALLLALAWTYARVAHSRHLGLAKDKSCHKDCTGKQGDFTHYVLAEVHPAALCQSDKRFTCSYPNNVTLWTLHGLWPSVHHKRNAPTCCDPDAKFSTQSIQSLVPRLVKQWTNLETECGFYHMWIHEWTKHGTCCPDSFQPEYNYFNKTLTLFENGLNFDSILSKAGIQPSNSYTAREIKAAFGKGVVSGLKCSKIKKKVTLTEIRVCLSKSFKLTQCPGGRRPRQSKRKESDECPSSKAKHSKIFYAPADSSN